MQDRIKEIRHRLGEISPAPWYKRNDLDRHGEYTDTFKIYNVPIPYSEEGLAYVYSGNEDIDRNNTDFIANSPSDIQFLLAALEEAQERIKEMEEYENKMESEGTEIEARYRDRERVLREALEEINDNVMMEAGLLECMYEEGTAALSVVMHLHDAVKVSEKALGQEVKP